MKGKDKDHGYEELERISSLDVLEASPERALKMLRALGTRLDIREQLARAGYTEAEQELGWKLVLEASGYGRAPRAAVTDAVVRDALLELDAADEPLVRRLGAALTRLHPAQADFVMSGVSPGVGAASVVTVATLLARLAALGTAPERASMKAEDDAALATLEARGLGAAERARLDALVRLAQSARPVVDAAPDASDAARFEAVKQLHAWFADWSETARAVVKRRDQRILLGLARRRDAKTDEADAASSANS